MAQKVASKVEIFIIAVVCIVLLFFALKSCGIDMAKTSTETEMIDRPHAE